MPSSGTLNTSSQKFDFDSNVAIVFAAIGVFVLLLPVPTGSIYGYGVIFFALLGLLMLHLALQTKMNLQAGFVEILKKMLISSQTIPVIALMGVIAWLMSMNIRYYDKYNTPDMLPQEFMNFKGLATGLILISVILVKTITDDETQESKALNKKKGSLVEFYKYAAESASGILYLLIAMLGITAGIMQVILQYYLTDG
tara:strand:- start:4317 stop:4910 length:594 start_codon:yes stop_codon:yes gene_type:complete